jgi:hypothetical protein
MTPDLLWQSPDVSRFQMWHGLVGGTLALGGVGFLAAQGALQHSGWWVAAAIATASVGAALVRPLFRVTWKGQLTGGMLVAILVAMAVSQAEAFGQMELEALLFGFLASAAVYLQRLYAQRTSHAQRL